MALEYQKELDDLMLTVSREGGSDLHLSEGRAPVIRVAGSLIPLVKKVALSHEDMEGFLNVMLSAERQESFTKRKDVDFAYSYQGKFRFRCNAYIQQERLSLAMRLILDEIRTIEQLNLPPILEMFAEKKQGFFLVVGPTGHGKSTTLAALINKINLERMEHIITIEDPIEYLFKPQKSMIEQREVGSDTPDFATGLHGVFRQDVNVVMIGEMREPKTMSTAVTAAETGHLVFSTLHTNNASQTVERIIDSFPPNQQTQIRLQLANTLIGVFSQRLVPRVSGGLVPAVELLIANNAVANLIRDSRTHELNTVIETSSQDGMIDMNRSLVNLVRAGEITIENAYRYSFNPKTLEKLI